MPFSIRDNCVQITNCPSYETFTNIADHTRLILVYEKSMILPRHKPKGQSKIMTHLFPESLICYENQTMDYIRSEV